MFLNKLDIAVKLIKALHCNDNITCDSDTNDDLNNVEIVIVYLLYNSLRTIYI